MSHQFRVKTVKASAGVLALAAVLSAGAQPIMVDWDTVTWTANVTYADPVGAPITTDVPNTYQ